jgi:hypothetical protein
VRIPAPPDEQQPAGGIVHDGPHARDERQRVALRRADRVHARQAIQHPPATTLAPIAAGAVGTA